MHNTKALLPNVLILVVNALGVLLACYKNFNLTLLIHKNDVETKSGYKTDFTDAKTFKWRILMRRKNLLLSTRACRHAQVFIRERLILRNGLLRRRLRVV